MNTQKQVNETEQSEIPETLNIQPTSTYDIDNNEDDTLKKYKKDLLIIVLGVFLICIIIIVERIFFETLIEGETNLLKKLQKNWNLIQIGEQYSTFNKNFFLSLIGVIDEFEINFMIITTIFITLYVSVNAIITTKTIYISLLGYFFISCLQILYSGPRPYWESNLLSTSQCLQSYSQPSKDVFITLFLIYYLTYCFIKKNLNQVENYQANQRKFTILRIVLTIFSIAYFFIRYIIAQAYLTEMVISVLFFLLYYKAVIFLDKFIDELVRKSAIDRFDSKRYVFYWFFWIILFQVMAIMFYAGSENFVNINWIQNYVFCLKSKNNLPLGVPYDELIGPWFTFLNTTVLFGLVAGVFGIAHCFRNIKVFEWYGGTLKNKILRVACAWVSMIPSWVLVIFQNQIVNAQWIRLSGLNEYFINAIHFFVLYTWLFGYLPIIVFQKTGLIDQPQIVKPSLDDSFNNQKPFVQKTDNN